MTRRVIGRLAKRDLADKTSAFAAASTIGASFAPNLLPRGPLDQALATGLSASLSYGVANITQSLIDGLSWKIAPGRERSRMESRKYLNSIANLTAIGAGLGLQYVFRETRGEPVKRAAVRTFGWELTASGMAGLGITAVSGLAEEYERRHGGELHPAAVPVGFAVGGLLSAAEIVWYRRNQDESPPLVESLAQGLVVMGGVTAVGIAESRGADLIAGLVRKNVPGLALLAEPIGHLIGIGVLGGAVAFGLDYAYQKTEQGGGAVEAAYSDLPTAVGVSGGPKSSVDWMTLSREGRRFVNMVLEPEQITAVTGKPAMPPIRAFVGLVSAPTVDSRVALAMDELEAMGAFERSVLCVCSPTGTGYINYVAIETLEYLTGGDCATVGLQYSLRPSFLSLDRVGLGREQNRALLHAISGRLMGISPDKRPRLVMFGESLGAHTMQDAFIHEGTSGMRRAGVLRALFVGTPAESKWAEQWRFDPDRYDPGQEVVEVASYEEWAALPEDRQERARYVLLSHHEDPIPKFAPALTVQAPPWMADGPTRSPAVTEGVKWRPFTTFILTAVDMKNATNVIPGKFEALGHDYRADLARFVVLAYNLDVTEDELAAIETALRAREFEWAKDRLMADHFAQMREDVARQLNSWGSSGDNVSLELPSLPGLKGLSGLSSGSG